MLIKLKGRGKIHADCLGVTLCGEGLEKAIAAALGVESDKLGYREYIGEITVSVYLEDDKPFAVIDEEETCNEAV